MTARDRIERAEVRAYVTELFERWRDAQVVVRGDGVAAFARHADVPDGSLRVWLGRAGPKKREQLVVPSAVYLLRLIRAVEDSAPAPARSEADEDGALEEALVRMADELSALRAMLEGRRRVTEASPPSPIGQAASLGVGRAQE